MNLEGPERVERSRILLGKISIEDILGHYQIPLGKPTVSRKGGLEYHMVCCVNPNHQTESETLSINNVSGKWLCRSSRCNMRGDLVRFVALKEGVGDTRAYEILCERAGIQIQDINELSLLESMIDQVGRAPPKLRESLKPIPWPGGYKVKPHPYLVGQRRISIPVLEAARAGVIEGNTFYQYRACIPIMMGGKLYSIYSRAIASEKAWLKKFPHREQEVKRAFPKHHYPEASATSKLLYGLDEALASNSDTIIIVEAIISVLRLRTMGFDNAIASMRAGLSEEQIKLLLRRCNGKKIILCFDSDCVEDPVTGQDTNVGKIAAQKAYRQLRDFLDVGIATLPLEVDPADMDASEEFQEVLDKVFWPQKRVREQREIAAFVQGGT